ncbi:MAG: DUF3854 domain-containing protein, partial [Actinomycetota bacterium]|nr:DUF3854 domain-containing protein [Actinomycetota bacterium]
MSAAHLRTVRDESAIAEEVLAEHEVRTIAHGRELPRGFSGRQRGRAPGILFTIPRPNGEPGYNFRPDAPDPENPGHKYEQPCKALGGPGNVLGVYETSPGLLRDASVTVVFTEGAKKGLSLLSAARASGVELAVVVVSGVWNWLSGGAPIPDMLEVPIEGRKVVILFDSDMLSNPNVQDAAQRLAEYLMGRGAEVWVAFLHDGPGGSKTGADDFFANGGTLRELRMLTRPYVPADFSAIRLSRDERLRLAVENLERRFWDFEWKGMGGHSARDVYLKLVEAARRHGKIHPDGLRIVKAQGPLSVEAKVSSRTLWKSVKRLEEWGLLYRDNEGRERDKAGAFVLRASVSQYEKGGAPEGKATG